MTIGKSRVLAFLILTLLGMRADPAISSSVARSAFVPKCQVSSAQPLELPRPHRVLKSNNLVKAPNSLFHAVGRKVVFEGYVVDINGVPINNAIVEIWQRNAYGFYQEGISARNLQFRGELDYFDPYFLSSGTAQTDNTGFYRFFTVVPYSSADCPAPAAPVINLSIRIPSLRSFRYDTSVDLSACLATCVQPGQAFNLCPVSDLSEVLRFDVTLNTRSRNRKF